MLRKKLFAEKQSKNKRIKTFKYKNTSCQTTQKETLKILCEKEKNNHVQYKNISVKLRKPSKFSNKVVLNEKRGINTIV